MYPDTFVYPFENLCRVVIPGTRHELGTARLMYRATDDSIPPKPIFGVHIIDSQTHDFTLTFVVPQSGRIVLTAA